ncbi:PepSY domain-containing protein [Nonomuraea turkmeniaca]|uniref:PepSY domain-containing protein n=1 Tax=Nonomuraea turkmeniaca TaxID=103838 RepID=A0A5S4F1E4_9ACTN|nr:PepSY domain-containing protein [Nonomuraea turkmeniaca]TMR09906.1 PepSY domain-containing protein [Nonomuraea turkmeniaca]
MRITKKLIVVGTGVVALVAGGGAAAFAATTAAAPKVTAEKAMEIAHKAVPGAWVSELDYDRRGTRPDTWEIELTKGSVRHEVDVDAATGKVTEHGTKQADDDRDGDDD